MAFIIADAPGHGKQYHDYDDSYPVQPERALENALLKFKTLPDTNVFFTAMTLNDYPKKMFDILKAEFGNNFEVTNQIVPDEFFDTMFNSLTNTIEESRLQWGSRVRQAKSKPLDAIEEEKPEEMTIKATSLTPILPKVKQYQIDDATFWKGLKKDVDSRSIKDTTELTLFTKELGQGKTSSVFKMRDSKKELDMVCKLDFRVLEGDTDMDYDTA